jgi:hypothetical protein
VDGKNDVLSRKEKKLKIWNFFFFY